MSHALLKGGRDRHRSTAPIRSGAPHPGHGALAEAAGFGHSDLLENGEMAWLPAPRALREHLPRSARPQLLESSDPSVEARARCPNAGKPVAFDGQGAVQHLPISLDVGFEPF